MVKCDKIGPEKIIQIYNLKIGMKGILVIDNTKRGPGKGEVRMIPDVSVEEVAKLARAMTYKTAFAELFFGGAKGGIIADSKKLSKKEKEEGYIVVNKKQETSLASIYATGDITNNHLKQFIIATAEGAIVATNVYETLKLED